MTAPTPDTPTPDARTDRPERAPSALLDGVRLAWGTLTAIPGPPPTRVTPPVARAAMLSGWLVVLPVTCAAALVGWAASALGAPGVASGLLTLLCLQLATRGIHADGLADTIDGLGSGRTRERALAIMRQGDLGPLGAMALVLVLGLQASLLGTLLTGPVGWLPVAFALASGRLGLTLGCLAGVPSARPDGLGQAVAGTVPRGGAALALVAATALGVLTQVMAGAAVGSGVLAPWAWPLALLLGLALAGLLLHRTVRALGGITGDVLGALVEVTTTGVLLGLVIA